LALRYRLIDLTRGSDAVGLLQTLRTQQFESQEKIQSASQIELEKYFDSLRRHVPLFKSATQFSDLPVIDKKFIREHYDELINPDFKGTLFRKKTGGSTGEPLLYYTGSRSQSYLWAGIFLSWEVAGYRLGDKVAFLAGPSLFGTGFKQSIYFGLLNVTVMSAFNMTPETMEQYGVRLQREKISLIYGYSSAVHLLARHFLNAGRTLHTNLKAIICTSETLLPSMRKDIEAAFGVPCYNQYGCNDAGVSAFECEHRNGLQLISSRSYAEVLPDGQFISTDLANDAMYMPRYNTGDFVKKSDRQCACGRGFPLLDEVLGRQNEMLVDTRGIIVHSLFFMYLFREDFRIRSFQVVFDESELVVNLHTVNMEKSDREQMEHNVRTIIARTLTFHTVTVIYNQPFAMQSNGKHCFVLKKSTISSPAPVLSNNTAAVGDRQAQAQELVR
jgi:phenylacetate-CoA ligase